MMSNRVLNTMMGYLFGGVRYDNYLLTIMGVRMIRRRVYNCFVVISW